MLFWEELKSPNPSKCEHSLFFHRFSSQCRGPRRACVAFGTYFSSWEGFQVGMLTQIQRGYPAQKREGLSVHTVWLEARSSSLHLLICACIHSFVSMANFYCS